MASGAFALAIAAIFATKANKRFTFHIHNAVGGSFTYFIIDPIFTPSHGGNLAEANAQLATAAGSAISSPAALFTKIQKTAHLYMVRSPHLSGQREVKKSG